MKNDVIIVGGGMVGAAMALKLAKQGCMVTVIEQQQVDFNVVLASEDLDLRVSAINRFSEQLFAELGILDNLLTKRHAPYRRLAAFEQAKQTLLFDAKDIDYDYLGHIIENQLIQAALWQAFASHNITVKSDLGKLNRIEQAESRITLHYGKSELTADLVIAADGGQSITRQLAGIGTTGWQYQQSCMGILIKLDAPQQDITWQQFQATGPVAFLPLQAPYANLIWYHSGTQLAKLAALNPGQLKQKVIEHFPTLPGDFEVIEQAVFPLTRQHANQYVQGRLVLVGDSAHTINPLAGQGVNLGFKDVQQLATCLANKLDVGDKAALLQYQRYRKTANLVMMSAMDACYLGFSNQIPPLKWLRNKVLATAERSGPLKNWVLKYAIGEKL